MEGLKIFDWFTILENVVEEEFENEGRKMNSS